MISKIKQLLIKKIFKNRVRIDNEDSNNIYEIVVYFNAPVSSIYQIKQWLDVFKELHKKHKIVFIVRRKSTYDWLINNTDYTVFFCFTYKDLVEVYENNDFKLVLYVNNGVHNFQSLSYKQALHIFINHGESEKPSTVSNQVNAYNYIFIVGDMAYNKYKLNLLEFDEKKFIKVGRPQLESIKPIKSIKTNKKIVLYAPTWEGSYESMNYTSLNKWGLLIIEKLIKSEKYHIIYKPHPNTGYNDLNIKKINKKIINILSKYNEATVFLNENIIAIYEHVDIAIFDNSAVAIDYLSFNKPMIITDLFDKMKNRLDTPLITQASVLLSNNNIDNLIEIIEFEINNDSMQNSREKIKKYILGDLNYKNQESTTLFIKSISNLIKKRDILLENLKRINLEYQHNGK